MGNSYESGVYVCLQSPGKVRNPPEVWSSGGGGGGGGGGSSNSSSSNRDYEAGASPSRVPGFSVMLRKPRNPRRKFANFQPVRRRRRVTWGRPGSAHGALSPRTPSGRCHLRRPAAGCSWSVDTPVSFSNKGLVNVDYQIYEDSKMNLEQERPFVCSAPGCSQRFPTEDHLMIHRHKHEMTLKFPSIKTDNMLSDQTPTPTRFLKNCEEVGLFSELDCSFEHEFRKTQEEENSKRNISMHNTVGGAMTGPGAHPLGSTRMPNHDTSVVIQQAMPSPQSSSVITQAPSTNRQIGPVPGSLSSLLHLHNRQRQPMPASMPGTLPNPTMPGSSAVLMPMERQMSVNSSIMSMQGPNLSNPCASPQVQPMHSEAKMRLKAALTHHPAAMSNGNMSTIGHMMEMRGSRQDQTPHHHMHSHPHQHQTLPPHHPYPHQHQHPAHHPHPQPHHQQSHPHHHSHPHLHAHPAHHQTSPHPPLHTGNQAQVSPATQQMQPTQTIQPPQPTGGRRRRVVDEDPDERRRKFLERNRAAATRCRQKRKVWVMSLEKKAEELTQTNMQLQNEVSMLKNEVAQLKQLLLTHKDCPITAMQKESQGYLSPESSPPASPVPACSQQQVIQHNTITTSSSVSEVVGSSTLSQLTTHRTDLNPIL